jgi:hypothetical protein
MGSKESLLRNKYKKQPFQKPQLVFYLLTCYIWLSIYIWDCGGKRRRREGEKEKMRRELTPEGQGRWWWNAGGKCRRDVEKVR